MNPQPLVVTPETYPQPLDVVGEKITVLATGEATRGYEIFLQDGPEGSGPPPHSHPWDESFVITRGAVAFGLGDEQVTATPGTLVHIPAGTTHWFRFGEDGATMVSMTSKLGASRLFADLSREIAPDAPDLAKLVGIAARHEVTVTV
ncbi:MAG: cupin domain-containing protein [Gammaproteobacteria bacterium]|nr:cupin domain-containing protein [Gammaproteobacteria bacterium]